MTDKTQNGQTRFASTLPYRRYVLGLLLLVMTLNYADRYVIGILLPQIKSDLALTETQIAFLAFLIRGWITENHGWRATLVSFGAPGVLIALVVYCTLRDPPPGHSDGVQVVAKVLN